MCTCLQRTTGCVGKFGVYTHGGFGDDALLCTNDEGMVWVMVLMTIMS